MRGNLYLFGGQELIVLEQDEKLGICRVAPVILAYRAGPEDTLLIRHTTSAHPVMGVILYPRQAVAHELTFSIEADRLKVFIGKIPEDHPALTPTTPGKGMPRYLDAKDVRYQFHQQLAEWISDVQIPLKKKIWADEPKPKTKKTRRSR